MEVYPEPDKLGKQFKYAAASGVAYVAVVGGDERAQGVVTVKDMKTGEQTQVRRPTSPAQLSTGRLKRARTPEGRAYANADN